MQFLARYRDFEDEILLNQFHAATNAHLELQIREGQCKTMSMGPRCDSFENEYLQPISSKIRGQLLDRNDVQNLQHQFDKLRVLEFLNLEQSLQHIFRGKMATQGE